MFCLTPNSFGTLREENFCHLPDSGRFAAKGQGNCQGGVSKAAPDESTLHEDLDFAESSDDVQKALDKAGAIPLRVAGKDVPDVFITENYVVEWDGEDKYPSYRKKDDWVERVDPSDYFPDYEDNLNKEFWDSGGEVYHATTEENADEIEKHGIEARNRTRGLSNRSTGSAVFTTTDIEDTAIGSYGDEVFAIDTGAMKRDKYTPYTAQEPDVVEAELRSALAWALGIQNYEPEREYGMDPTTVAIFGNIPAKYVRRMPR